MGVEDHDVEGRGGHVLAGPTHLDAVVARLGRVVLADDGAVLLVLALHLDAEGALRTAHSHRQLHTHTHTHKEKTHQIKQHFLGIRNKKKQQQKPSILEQEPHVDAPPQKKRDK